MPKREQPERLDSLPLVGALKRSVKEWRDSGYAGVTDTTHELLRYWFDRDEDAEERFYRCQQQAIETVLYCHEVLRADNLAAVYQQFAADSYATSEHVRRQVDRSDYPRYCLKMATGTGKTWVLAALLVWHYFNAQREKLTRYSDRFLVVAPGRIVRDRLLDSFKGKLDPLRGVRDPAKSDYARDLFMPRSPEWRGRFHLEVLEMSDTQLDVRPNAAPPQGAVAVITNWHKLFDRKREGSLWEQFTGPEVDGDSELEEKYSEVMLDWLTDRPRLVMFNDEAHHVHDRGGRSEDVDWLKATDRLCNEMKSRHGSGQSFFAQMDFSATPFYGSAESRDYFPHIVYDYTLAEAMDEMLVKQLFLEERRAVSGERLEELDFRAVRAEPEGRRVRGEVSALSRGQKLMIDIGLKKLDQLRKDFDEREIEKKPVLFVLAEEIEVAKLVSRFITQEHPEHGRYAGQDVVLTIYSTRNKSGELTEKEMDEVKKKVFAIDQPGNPCRIVVSVLMLREGFDVKNICVTVVLRSTDSDILLEQIVGRGLRLMFTEPEFLEPRHEAMLAIRKDHIPENSFDCLFIVEHPRFRRFYDELRKSGYSIGSGDTSGQTSAGDIVNIDLDPRRLPEYDLAWPALFYDEGRLPDPGTIDVASLAPYGSPFDDVKKHLSSIAVAEVYVPTAKRVRTWKLENEFFDYGYFLRSVAEALVRESNMPVLTARKADLMGLTDRYVSERLFKGPVDFSQADNYRVLNYVEVFDWTVTVLRRALTELLEKVGYETVASAKWRRISEVGRIQARASALLEVGKCPYPKLGYQARGGGFERDFMAEVLRNSMDVKAFCKLEQRHELSVPYRNEFGILRRYWPDFIVRTADSMYIVETKAERDMVLDSVALKARAGIGWCEAATAVSPPSDVPQPQRWEYVILPEDLFKAARELTFEALVPMCRGRCNAVIANAMGRLF